MRASGANFYKTEAIFNTSGFNIILRLWRTVGGSSYLLAETTTASCGTLKSSVQGSLITVAMNGTPLISLSDSTFASGNLGVGTLYCGGTSGIGSTVLAYVDTQAPSVPTGLTAVPYSTRVNLSWTASTDNVGVSGYKVYRNGTYLGSPTSTSYTDLTVYPVTTYSYTVSAYDVALNESAQSTPLPVTTPATSFSALDTGGPVEYASTWGAGPEKIALLTGALALRIPLFKLQHRTRGPGFPMMASWNSQFWSWDAAGTKMSAIDTGYGLGWNFTLGGMYPIYSGNELVRFEFVDAAGVIHKLLPTGTPNQYKSQDSTYLLWDYAARTLTFTGGTVWFFECTSQEPEPDAGTRYPTRLRDTNGNLIDITYEPASGQTQTNTSARIRTIKDSLTTYTWEYTTINGAPHVSRVYHYKNPGEQFNDAIFTYLTTVCVGNPFGEGQDPTCPPGQGNAVLLKEISFTGAVGPFKFDYNASAEITKLTVPHKGYFRYTYITASFSNNGRKIREVSARHMSANGSLPEESYTFSHPSGDAALPQHTQTTLLDPANNKKVWFFIQGSPNGWDNGLENKYEVRPGPSFTTVLRTVDTTWTQDNPASQSLTNPRVFRVVTALEDGITKNKREQDVDSNGNVTQVRDYDFDWATVPFRTTSTTYLNNTNYTSRNILNRPSQITVCAGVAGCATPSSTTTITYDTSGCNDVPGITQYDPAYNAILYRGNPRSVNANGVVSNQGCDIGGNLTGASDSLGHTLATAGYNSEASQLASITSGGSNTSINYNNDTTPSNITGSNSDTVSFTYGSYRPTNIQRPDGSQITYSYSDTTNPVSQTQAGALGTTTTTLDGFGRVIKTARQENATTWTYTETQYSACSCSSTGKAVKTSRPYRAGQTPVWTETLYDALGRPTRVNLPDGNFTTYTYSVVNDGTWAGSLTLITDPAGKRKRYLHGMRGTLIRVEEPDAANNLIETARYTYDVMGRMTTVQMGKRPDNTFKQTRTFVYNTAGQLTSATNPENGAVSYTYFADGLPQSKTDAKNQTLWFFYDVKHRLLRIESPQGTVKTSFTYDTNATVPATNAQGRMTSAANDGYTWHFSYDIMGRVNSQVLQTAAGTFAKAAYAYNAFGQPANLCPPGAIASTAAGAATAACVTYGYDLLGRPLNIITGYTPPDEEGNSSPIYRVQDGQYNAAGQITSWRENQADSTNYLLTRSYNDQRGWVNNIRAQWRFPDNSSVERLNLTYGYLANGRASSVTDVVNPGQSVSAYEYDQLNRLTKATTPNWALQWTYDEFGNRLTQTKVPGSTGTPPETTLSYGESTNRIATGGYTYDLNGNLTALPGLTVTYDVFDRAVNTNGTTAKYDAFGRRIERVSGGATKIYFYDMGGRLLAEYGIPSVGQGPTRRIEYFAGQRLGQYTDRTGNVRFSVYAGGGTAWHHYYPFGEEITGTSSDTYKFADLYRDADTGLDYAMARYHSSTIGRFLTPDPSGRTVDRFLKPDSLARTAFRPLTPQGGNLYAYVLNDPTNYKDPLGLDHELLDPGDPVDPGDCGRREWYAYLDELYPSAVAGGMLASYYCSRCMSNAAESCTAERMQCYVRADTAAVVATLACGGTAFSPIALAGCLASVAARLNGEYALCDESYINCLVQIREKCRSYCRN